MGVIGIPVIARTCDMARSLSRHYSETIVRITNLSWLIRE
jgi:hypothetical protein